MRLDRAARTIIEVSVYSGHGWTANDLLGIVDPPARARRALRRMYDAGLLDRTREGRVWYYSLSYTVSRADAVLDAVCGAMMKQARTHLRRDR